MDENQKTENRPETGQQNPTAVKGLDATVRLMENYLLLKEYAMKEPQNDPVAAPGAILDVMQQSRRDTCAVVREINDALGQIRVAAQAGGYGYKLEAFERHYLQGQTYEQIADAMNAGRNSPGRWCKEIMQKMAVYLFGVNGIAR